MLLRSATSMLLAAWVAFACPLLCTMTALPDDQSSTATGNCCDRCGRSDSPVDKPAPPDERPAGSCFCSHLAAFLSADDLSVQIAAQTMVAVVPPETDFAPSPAGNPDFDSLYNHRPPDLERTLPLLI